MLKAEETQKKKKMILKIWFFTLTQKLLATNKNHLSNNITRTILYMICEYYCLCNYYCH